MSDTKETIVLDFKIEAGDALNELAATKKAILGLKDEQKQLNDDYKKGKVDLDTYVKSQIQLEAALKKQTAQYNNVQKGVTGVKTSFDKLNDSIKEQSKSIAENSIGFSKLLNPVTATVAVLGGLFKAYSSSTRGAKDLEFAHNQLAIATGILTNEFSRLVTSGEDGEGFFTKSFNAILSSLGPAGAALAETSHSIALAQEAIDDLKRDELKIRAENADRLDENAEKLSAIGREQTSYNEKLKLYDEIIGNLRDNETNIVKVKQDQLDYVKRILDADKENEEKQNAALEAEK